MYFDLKDGSISFDVLYNAITKSAMGNIQCSRCINSIVKECCICGSKKRYCLLLNIDVNDDFYCKCWGEKTEDIDG